MKHIATKGELDVLSRVDQSVFDILNDPEIGRAKASRLLAEKGFTVSEKVIRNWRSEHQTPSGISISPTTLKVVGKPFGHWESVSLPPVQPGATVTFMRMPEKAKTIVIMPDVQAPLHDAELVEKFIRFLKDFKPDELAQVGDFTDSTEISRWVRGKKMEYAGDLRAGFQTAKGILHDIREVFDGRFRIVRSNHDDRLEAYVEGCAAGLAPFLDDELSIERLAGFNEYDVEFVRDEVVELAPGWVMAHGDEGSLSPVAGKTAFGLAKNKFGVSTVCGHTHRAGLTSESTGYNGKIRNTLTGLEVGHFMDLTKADYLKKKGVAANWQQGFGILEVYGNRVYPQLITVRDGRFSVNGVEY